MEGKDSKERRREQNRLAQRRFRERHGKRKSADTALDESRHGSFRRSPGAGLPAENPDTLTPIFQWPYLDTNFASPKYNTSPATVYHDSCDSAAGNNIWSTPLNYAETIPALRQMSFDGDEIQQYLEAYSWKDFGEFLGNTGTDVTPTTTPTSRQDDTSRTSTLHVAVKKGNGRILRLLLKHGANSNLKDATGLTPLLQATISGHEEIVEILLSHGALVEQADDQSRSVLHWAILSGNQRLLKRYLKRGKGSYSFVNGCDREGKTALHLAVEMGLDAAVEVLLEHNAELD